MDLQGFSSIWIIIKWKYVQKNIWRLLINHLSTNFKNKRNLRAETKNTNHKNKQNEPWFRKGPTNAKQIKTGLNAFSSKVVSYGVTYILFEKKNCLTK